MSTRHGGVGGVDGHAGTGGERPLWWQGRGGHRGQGGATARGDGPWTRSAHSTTGIARFDLDLLTWDSSLAFWICPILHFLYFLPFSSCCLCKCGIRWGCMESKRTTWHEPSDCDLVNFLVDFDSWIWLDGESLHPSLSDCDFMNFLWI